LIDISICVPTWNRAGWLKACLESIRNQERGCRCEVWVRDNASDDETETVFLEAAEGRTDWHFVRNASNLGGMANIRLCTEYATAPYLLILGSDDALRPGALERLGSAFKLAKRHNAKAIFAHRMNSAKQCWRLDHGLSWLRHASINVPAFISSVVWKTEAWRNHEYNYDPLSVYTLPHLQLFIEACLEGAIIGCNEALVDVGHAEDSVSREDEAPLYGRWPLMDCFEYPELYRKILREGHLDFYTWLLTQTRRAAHFRHIPRKMTIIQYNQHHFDRILGDLLTLA
jgi:glycosyltransferase involved in cell wall biosynthesis